MKVNSTHLLITLFLASLLFSPGGSAQFRNISTKEIVRRNADKIVMIMTFDANQQPLAIGSGFYVSSEGIIATNFHVIKGSRSAILKENNSSTQVSIKEVLNIDYDRDLVLLKVNKKTPAVSFGNSDSAEVGDKVVAIGNPRGLSGTVSEGIISGLREIDNSFQLMQITAPISPGSSGGPLFDQRGNVIGVTTAYIEGSQNLNFAVPIRYIKALLLSPTQRVQFSEITYDNKTSKLGNSGIAQKELDLVKIINVDWVFELMDHRIEYSIYNGTNHQIKNIRVLIIFYDSRTPSLPVDSREEPESETIRAHLSKRIWSYANIAPIHYDEATQSTKSWWTAEFRILDYEIDEE